MTFTIETYAAEYALGNWQFYVDDGFSGTNFDRPDFQRMITDIENDIVGTVVVKDLSRFGRNYYQVGYYTEKFFLEHDIRFISIMDNNKKSKTNIKKDISESSSEMSFYLRCFQFQIICFIFIALQSVYSA